MDPIELYQSTELSYREVANHLGINNPASIINWMRIFRAEGIDGLSKTKESIARSIDSLRGSFKLVELLETLKFPKSTFMYWQKRFDRENPDQEIEEEMLKIRRHHKDYGCLRMTKELGNRGFHVNKEKVQRLIRKLSIEVRSFTRKFRRYHSYRGKIGTIAKNRIHRTLLHKRVPSKDHDRYNRAKIF